MAPPMVLLNRHVDFSHDEAAVPIPSPCPWGASNKEMSDAVIEYLRALKARAVVASPPQLSSLRILPPPNSAPLLGLRSGHISSADKNLVALYAGGYRPGAETFAEMGAYLIYDARDGSLSVIPPIPSHDEYMAMGHQSAVVMCDATGGGYLLAELVWVMPGFSRAAVWLWESSAKEWVLKPGCLPLPPNIAMYFSIHSCFSYRGSTFCWVDLHQGMVLCDLHQGCKLSFIELPQGRPNYDASDYPGGLCAEEFRSVACVRGSIKFLAFNKFVERKPGEEYGLTVWTLYPDHPGWSISYQCSVQDIWANTNYQSAGLRQLAPSFPVLSIHQDGVVYLVVNDTSVVGKDRRLVHKAQYLLRVDMGNNNDVQVYQQKTTHIYSQLFASEFSAHRRQDHPREIEAASESGASGKKTKA
ncbi:hypothetical protein CFC21_014481 [Triticum aestivum]|uniref:DUF1618 domain-containing protein n=2 Tax=Triticum aestivum TaxID=4565 RepID=A0A9R1IZJ3_WHEAT|nr:uncharacterized protein LOC123186972 [Triticum aestivum]KAF6998359.1 hypothetical protein CFC21_014481 [Triticum aestivum]